MSSIKKNVLCYSFTKAKTGLLIIEKRHQFLTWSIKDVGTWMSVLYYVVMAVCEQNANVSVFGEDFSKRQTRDVTPV